MRESTLAFAFPCQVADTAVGVGPTRGAPDPRLLSVASNPNGVVGRMVLDGTNGD